MLKGLLNFKTVLKKSEIQFYFSTIGCRMVKLKVVHIWRIFILHSKNKNIHTQKSKYHNHSPTVSSGTPVLFTLSLFWQSWANSLSCRLGIFLAFREPPLFQLSICKINYVGTLGNRGTSQISGFWEYENIFAKAPLASLLSLDLWFMYISAVIIGIGIKLAK